MYTMRQASRRSWRIGQKRPVKVVFMAYRNTLQADALKLVAKKLQSSLAVEGELPEDGLAAFGDDGDDLMLALARQIVSGEKTDADGESVEAGIRPGAGRRGQRRGVPGGRRLEAGRNAEAEPVVVEVHANGNGHAVEPVEVGSNGNGHSDVPAEGQQALFSWAEFLAEEPGKPKGRNRKPQPAAASLFEWALEREQERETEPVGAGR